MECDRPHRRFPPPSSQQYITLRGSIDGGGYVYPETHRDRENGQNSSASEARSLPLPTLVAFRVYLHVCHKRECDISHHTLSGY